MAKKMKAGDAEKVKGVHPDTLKRAVAEVLAAKERASEASGEAGQATKTFVENNNLDKKAFGVIVSLKKADDKKRQITLRAIIEYAHKLGFFDQVDAFDDLIGILREIVDAAGQPDPERKQAAPDAGVISAMIN